MTVECKNGDTYRGFLDETEDNMNCVLKDATRTDAKGNKTQVEHIFLRGSQISFFIFPNMLKKARGGVAIRRRHEFRGRELDVRRRRAAAPPRPRRGDSVGTRRGAAAAAARTGVTRKPRTSPNIRRGTQDHARSARRAGYPTKGASSVPRGPADERRPAAFRGLVNLRALGY